MENYHSLADFDWLPIEEHLGYITRTRNIDSGTSHRGRLERSGSGRASAGSRLSVVKLWRGKNGTVDEEMVGFGGSGNYLGESKFLRQILVIVSINHANKGWN